MTERLVRFLYGDPSGVIRGKQVHRSRFDDAVVSGLGLTRAQNAINVLDDLVPVEGMEPVGEIRIMPDMDTYQALPWLDGVGSVFCDQVGHDGTDWGGCPRSFLKRAVGRAGTAGLSVQASFENEFYLAERTPSGPKPWGDGPVYSSAGLDRAAPVVNDIVDALVEQGIEVEQAINEYGPGQQEISIRHADALRAADNQLRVRDTVRGIAGVRHGLLASFAPKPWADAIGSGCHLHFSLRDADGENVMAPADDPQGLSDRPGVPGRRPRPSARPRRAHLSVLPVLRSAAPRRLGRVHRLLGVRQPRGRAARRVAVPRSRAGQRQRRAQDV